MIDQTLNPKYRPQYPVGRVEQIYLQTNILYYDNQRLKMMQALQKLFIRPSRHIYNLKDLGPPRFPINNRQVHRQDLTISSKNNKKLQASLYLFQPLQSTKQLIIYLHCNSGSRVEGAAHAKQVLEAGFAYMVFDFCGSWLSEGEYITLGANESRDVQAVVDYVKNINQEIKVVLWGRSMGAVASLIYLTKHHEEVTAAVLDSPFCSLRELALHIWNSQTSIPKFMLEGFIRLLNSHLKQKTKLDLLTTLSLSSSTDFIPTPALFLGSKSDSIVPFTHIQTLYSQYCGVKQIYYLDQDHHQRRPLQTISFVLKFISRHLYNTFKLHKKTLSNLSSLKPKHSVSQLDFRVSLDGRKIELVTKSARRREEWEGDGGRGNKEVGGRGLRVKEKFINLNSKLPFNANTKAHKDYFAKANQEKKKFIHLIDRNTISISHVEEKPINYATQSVKLIRNQTQLFKHTNSWKRQPIKLCKKNKSILREPLKDIIFN